MDQEGAKSNFGQEITHGHHRVPKWWEMRRQGLPAATKRGAGAPIAEVKVVLTGVHRIYYWR